MYAMENADLIFMNGRIITCKGGNTTPSAEAIAVKNGRILLVGSTQEVLKLRGEKTDVRDLEGCSVIPGMFDSHTHLLAQGQSRLMFDANPMCEADILENARCKAVETASGEWIEGYCGFRNESWDNDDPEDFMSVRKLDEVSLNHPLYIHRTVGQGSILRANSVALRLAGIAEGTPLYEQNILREEVCRALEAVIPSDPEKLTRKALLAAQDEMFSYGVTSCVFVCVSELEAQTLEEMYAAGELKLRINAALGNLAGDSVESIKKRMLIPPCYGKYGGRYSARSVKLFADGTFGRHTAALLDDYSDQPDCLGTLNYSDEELYQIFSAAARAGYQPLIHTVGDRAMKQVLNAYERVTTEQRLRDHRFKIEHLQLMRPEDPARIKRLGLVASMQAAHAPYNRIMTENRLGPERMKWTYALRPVWETGTIIVGGSDAPVQKANPFEGIYAAVTRKYIDGQPENGYVPENAISRDAALLSYTSNGAYGVFAESYLGTLEAGKLADFAVLDRDYSACPLEELKQIQVLCTVCAGEIVYQR